MKLNLEYNNLFLINKCTENLFSEFIIDILKNNTINNNIHIYSNKIDTEEYQEDIFYLSQNQILTIQNQTHIDSMNFGREMNSNKFDTLFIVYSDEIIEYSLLKYYSSILTFNNKVILVCDKFNLNFKDVNHVEKTYMKNIQEKIINF